MFNKLLLGKKYEHSFGILIPEVNIEFKIPLMTMSSTQNLLWGGEENFIVTHSDVSLFARNTFIAAPKSSLDKGSSSGNSDD